MRILFLSSLQEGSLGYSFANAMKTLGHEVLCQDYRATMRERGLSGLRESIKKSQNEVDLIFVLKGDAVDPRVITKCPKVLFYPDAAERYIDDINYSLYDKAFACDPIFSKDAEYIPVGVDPQYNPMCKTWTPVKKIVFPATGREERVEWVRRLYNKYGMEVYGNGWNKKAPFWKGEPLYNRKLTELSEQSEWMFNLIYGDGVNSRVYETLIMGGAVLITQHTKELEKQFVDKKHMYIFRDIEELCDILDNPPSMEEMNRVRSEGQKEVLEKHLIVNKMKYMLEECKKLL